MEPRFDMRSPSEVHSPWECVVEEGRVATALGIVEVGFHNCAET